VQVILDIPRMGGVWKHGHGLFLIGSLEVKKKAAQGSEFRCVSDCLRNY
jgi:hypothetical protein